MGFAQSLLSGAMVGAVLAVFVTPAIFIAGTWFSIKAPNAHIDEFSDVLAHGEFLLTVIVVKNRVVEIEDMVHCCHPKISTGGVGWSTEALGVIR